MYVRPSVEMSKSGDDLKQLENDANSKFSRAQ